MTGTPDPHGAPDVPVALDPVAGWVAVYEAALADRARADTVAAAARAHLEAALGDATVGTVDGVPVLRWTPVTTRRLDTRRVRQAVPPGMLADCWTETTTRRLTLTTGGDPR